jgi:starch-binding outer membrane protein, SusD/RagB family
MKRTRFAAGLLALLGVAACADLNVVNPNNPDAERALSSPGDVESLIAGSYGQWWAQNHSVSGNSPIFGNQSFMWSAFPANFGMFQYSRFPREAIFNVSTDQFYGNYVNYSWTQLYRAASAVAQGLQALESDPALGEELGDERVRRINAYAKFVQGLVHGHLALLYDEAFIIDETVDVSDPGDPVPYTELLTSALGYFDQAIQLANAGGFEPIPSTWMNGSVDAAQLARIASTMKARYRMNVARTPAEREAVNWPAVLSDLDNGLQDTWYMNLDYLGAAARGHGTADYMSQPSIGWNQVSYMITGMADQSGMYQDWLSTGPEQREPNFANGDPRLIITPDLRFPQGSTVAEQQANPGIVNPVVGSRYHIIGPRDWRNPERGSYRWSYYRMSQMDHHRTGGNETPSPAISIAEINLMRAEAHIRQGNAGAAADLINITRTAAGLNATDAAGTNTSCVPKLPNGSCGDLLEMMKWELRMEVALWGIHTNSWFFAGRGWGDLWEGTPTQLPIPCLERELLLQPCNTYGGEPGATGSAARSVYGIEG